MAPEVRVEVVEVVECRPGAVAGRWSVTWLVHNDAPEPLALEAAWIPHGRFRGDGRIKLSGQLPAHGSRRLQLEVTAHEPAGTLVENAFLILRVSSGGDGGAWRIFTRMRIEFDPQAQPRPSVELVTTQRLP